MLWAGAVAVNGSAVQIMPGKLVTGASSENMIISSYSHTSRLVCPVGSVVKLFGLMARVCCRSCFFH